MEEKCEEEEDGELEVGKCGGGMAQKDECYYGVRWSRLVWNNNFLRHITLACV